MQTTNPKIVLFINGFSLHGSGYHKIGDRLKKAFEKFPMIEFSSVIGEDVWEILLQEGKSPKDMLNQKIDEIKEELRAKPIEKSIHIIYDDRANKPDFRASAKRQKEKVKGKEISFIALIPERKDDSLVFYLHSSLIFKCIDALRKEHPTTAFSGTDKNSVSFLIRCLQVSSTLRNTYTRLYENFDMVLEYPFVGEDCPTIEDSDYQEVILATKVEQGSFRAKANWKRIEEVTRKYEGKFKEPSDETIQKFVDNFVEKQLRPFLKTKNVELI